MTKYSHPTNFLSNLDARDKPAILKAASVTGTQIYIQNKAFDGHGCRLFDCVAILSKDMNQDHTDMWITYNDYKAGRF